MAKKLSKPKRLIFFDRWKSAYLYLGCVALVLGVFFLGQFWIVKSNFAEEFYKVDSAKGKEVFGFAPYWTLSKMDHIDWDILTTFAYFSLPVNTNGTISKNTYEWQVFEGDQLGSLFKKADDNNVRKVVTLTMMNASSIENFLNDPTAWENVSHASVDILKDKDLDGVNIDFEYIPRNDYLKKQFSSFVDTYTKILNENIDNPYITVSVLASSVRFAKIYDIEHLAKTTDGVFMMAYDFYYPGSETIGPSAPLYGYNNGNGPFWYDVSTSIDDFLKVASADKIIMGVPYYGWNYPASFSSPDSSRSYGRAFATTLTSASDTKLISTTPVGGWDDTAKVSWRGYWDESGWHIVYLEDAKSLSYKYDFARSRGLAGVGIWALGYDHGEDTLWSTIKSSFSDYYLASNKNTQWNLF